MILNWTLVHYLEEVQMFRNQASQCNIEQDCSSISILSTFLLFTFNTCFITNHPGRQFAHHLILSLCTVCRTIKADIGTSIVAAQTVVHTVHIPRAWRPTVCN